MLLTGKPNILYEYNLKYSIIAYLLKRSQAFTSGALYTHIKSISKSTLEQSNGEMENWLQNMFQMPIRV